MDAVSYVTQVMKPMEPQPTGWSPACDRLPGIKVAVFDIYGTLLQSAAGDSSHVSDEASVEGMRLACRALGVIHEQEPETWKAHYERGIRAQQRLRREGGEDFPEVEIREVWRGMADALVTDRPSDEDVERAALGYECVVNPTWIMPGAREMIEALASRALPMGLISNAQFYTHHVLEAALASKGECFEKDLSLFSYEERCAKPSPRLFETMRDRLEANGVSAQEVIFFGNDLEKDILPARAVGFRTGLFAGDRRSLRVGDKSEPEVRPLCDVILTDWSQWGEVLG